MKLLISFRNPIKRMWLILEVCGSMEDHSEVLQIIGGGSVADWFSNSVV